MNSSLILMLFLMVWPFQLAAKNIYITVDKDSLTNPEAQRDGTCRVFYELRQALLKLGYDVKSFTFPLEEPLEDFEYLFFINPPEPYLLDQLKKFSREQCIGSIWEPPTVRPDYYYNDFRSYFSKMLVMADNLVDDKYFAKFFYPQPNFTIETEIPDFKNKKLCTLIAGNKKSYYSLELYSARKNAIEFFEKYHQEQFEFYGTRWPSSACYRGPVRAKRSVLKNYRFCICYENTRDLNGYITEKIFDCFVSGCVPVYWGAGNIIDYIPKNCFIDRRDFANNEELYSFLNSMKKEQYDDYLQNIKNYLKSEKAFLFSIEYFIDTILSLFFQGYSKKQVFSSEQLEKLAKARAYYENLHKFSINPYSPA